MLARLEALKIKVIAMLRIEWVRLVSPTSGDSAPDVAERRLRLEQSMLGRQNRWRLLC